MSRSTTSSVRLCAAAALGAAMLAGSVATAGAAVVGHARAHTATGLVGDPAALVDPFVGTENGGNTFPGADRPFGMMQWTPDTPSRPPGGGYSYTDSSIIGYSLNALSGPGCSALDDVPILPTSGAIPADPTDATTPLDHAEETATPGYYALDSGGITTRLTTAMRAGIGTFSFPADPAGANLLLKLSDSGAGDFATRFAVVGRREVEGAVTSGNFCDKTDNMYTLHFVVRFNRPIARAGTWTNATSGPATLAPLHGGASGVDGADVSFDAAHATTVTARIGISYVSDADAAQNLAAEIPGWRLAPVRAAAHAAWNAALSRIQIAGGTPAAESAFYTALYHSLLHPNLFSDVNGRYMGFDGRVHTITPGHPAYANFSGWDIYRSQSQLESMLFPRVMSDTVRSMLADDAQTGQLPKWSENDGESYEVLGDPADSIIADAWAFGARDFDVRRALADMVTEADVPSRVRPGLEQYLTDGYLPSDGSYGCCDYHDPIATVEEYDAADDSIAQFAASLGDESTVRAFAPRANQWQNLFDPGTGFLQEKLTDGAFASNFGPTADTGYEEGDSYVYRVELPFDIAGVAAALGGDANLRTALDGLTASVTAMSPTELQLDNEPSFDIPWEYDFVGEPDRTEQVVREAEDELYLDAPDGLAGNDDLGEMSSWLVWAAIGAYPEIPGSATAALGSPEFSSIAIHLGDGATIAESAPAAADDAPYVHALSVDGAAWDRAYLPGTLFTRGGTVDRTLATTADPGFASDGQAAPPSNEAGLAPALGAIAGPDGAPLEVLAPGTSTTLTLGAQSLRGVPQQVRFAASVSPGADLTVSPASGTLTLGAEQHASRAVRVSAPAGAAAGENLVTFHLTTASGARLPDVVESVNVAGPGDLDAFMDNVGISSDSDRSPADFDGGGNSYSRQQLAAHGISFGAALTAPDGIRYVFGTAATPSQPDNVVADGQTIPVLPVTGATRLGLLGAATDGPLTGDVTITYVGGTRSTVPLTLADWTLNGGGATPPSGDATVVQTPYRNETIGKTNATAAYLFSASVPLSRGRTVASVTLPASSDQGAIHVFAIGTDAGPLTR